VTLSGLEAAGKRRLEWSSRVDSLDTWKYPTIWNMVSQAASSSNNSLYTLPRSPKVRPVRQNKVAYILG